MTGFFHDIVTEALDRINVRVQWRPMPWARCQDNVAAGTADAMITVPTPDRLHYAATHADPFYLKKLNVFTYTGHPKLNAIRRLRSLDGIKEADFTVITYVRNSWNDHYIRSRSISVYETPVLKSVWRMLAAHRGDIVIEWPMAAWAEINAAGIDPDEIVQTDVTLTPMPFHLLISKRSPLVRILPEFNRVIVDMLRSGRIDEIVARYTSPKP